KEHLRIIRRNQTTIKRNSEKQETTYMVKRMTYGGIVMLKTPLKIEKFAGFINIQILFIL
ncbi:MAG: hypothetical protein KC440_08980, partial [Nitrosarchaeum sp.]|nr:hypothetical protein [Nitrosarchaeum sp.]